MCRRARLFHMVESWLWVISPAQLKTKLANWSALVCADATGGNNQTVTGTGMSARKLEDETEDFNGTLKVGARSRSLSNSLQWLHFSWVLQP
jgi:hypothetical protein